MNRMLVRASVAGLGALALCVSPARAGHYSWTTSGPEPGPIAQILAYSQNPDRLYVRAGVFGSTMFRSDDAGATWQFVENWPVSHLVADPTDPNVVYVTGQTLRKTTDGGLTWRTVQSGLPDGPLLPAVAPSFPSTLYAAAGYTPSLYRSDDGAESWSLVGSIDNSTTFLAVDPLDAQTLYRVSDDNLWVSRNGGVSWNPGGVGLPPEFEAFAADPRTSGTVWAHWGYWGVYKSVDFGATFAPANAGIDDQFVVAMAFDRADTSRMYVASDAIFGSNGTGGLFVSTDGGASWNPVDLGLQGPPSVLSVAIDPSNSSRVLAGAVELSRGRVMVTTDGGNKWQRADHGIGGYVGEVAASHPSQPDTAFGFSSARFFGTTDGGANWSQIGETEFTVTHLVFDPGDPSILYGQYSGKSFDGGVYKSVDGGATWNDASSGLENGFGGGIAIADSDPNVLLAGNTAGIFVSLDGAASWNPTVTGYGRAVAIDPSDGQIFYAAIDPTGNGNTVLQRSPDGGATWSAPSGAPAGIIPDIRIPAHDPSTVYAAAGSKVYKSTDRGLSFAPTGPGLPISPNFLIYRLALDPSAPGTLYVGSASEPTYRSTDAGASWAPIPGIVPCGGIFLDLSVSADGRRLYAASDNSITVFDRSFLDVADTDPFWTAIDAAAMHRLSAGCGFGNFCPAAVNTRAQVAIFLLRAKSGAAFDPPAATGGVFADVAADSFAAAWIEELSREGITSGCGGGNYCPGAELSRAEMAVMVLKALHGSDFAPPPATGSVFSDVPADAFAAAWIEQLFHEGISAGCGGGNFCPDASLTRAQAAALLARAFQLS